MVGVLSIRSTREEGFSPDDVELATVFASQAAIALENSRLYQKTQRTFDELTQAQDQLALGPTLGEPVARGFAGAAAAWVRFQVFELDQLLEPDDLVFNPNPNGPLPAFGKHLKGNFNILLADGSVRLITPRSS